MNAEAVSQLVTVLEKTTSPDQNDQKQASAFLEQAAQTNLPELIKVGICLVVFWSLNNGQPGSVVCTNKQNISWLFLRYL